mgnify:CR=1 FL=1|jgi:iron(III) transport system ATP-binding protein
MLQAPGATPLIVLEQVSKAYGPRPAVCDLSLTVAAGELLVLLGPSGCGKTTTLRLIAGFEQPDSGRIILANRCVAGPCWVPPEQRGVGMVFQDGALFPHLTVAENVAFGLATWPRAARAARVQAVLSLVGLADLAGRYPHQLSAGQQQRVALARALAPQPAVLLLDEPFANLDADLRSQMRQEVARILRQTGVTAVLVTHDQEEALVLADRVAVLHQGRLEQVGRPEEVYERPATRFVADFLGQADFLPGLAQNGTVLTEIGALPTATAHQGPVEVVIRPETVRLAPAPDGPAVIADRQFRGSQTLYQIRLPSGQALHSSQPSTVRYPVGLRVRVWVESGPVVTFPTATPVSAPLLATVPA